MAAAGGGSESHLQPQYVARGLEDTSKLSHVITEWKEPLSTALLQC